MNARGHQQTVEEVLKCWDSGQTVWSIELGGLGPGYEQAIQIAAIEFTRACKDLQGLKNDHQESTDKFTAACEATLKRLDDDLLGLSGAQFGAARWLAWQWCVNGGPEELQKRLERKGESSRAIQISKHWPKAPEQPKET